MIGHGLFFFLWVVPSCSDLCCFYTASAETLFRTFIHYYHIIAMHLMNSTKFELNLDRCLFALLGTLDVIRACVKFLKCSFSGLCCEETAFSFSVGVCVSL